MAETHYPDSAARWLADNGDAAPKEIVKATTTTSAWFARIAGQEVFARWYPLALRETWVKVETAISGGSLHPTLPDLAEPLAPLLARATCPARAGRFGTVREFSTLLGDALAALLPAV